MRRHWVWIFVAILTTGCGGSVTEETTDSEPEITTPSAPAAPQPAAQPAAAVPEGNAEAGKEEYTSYCSSCHGVDAKGMQGLGKTLVASEFVDQKSDAELIAYVKVGRPVDHPLNTTGIQMPPKGGNPALSDQEIANIIAYLRTLQP